jgi:hypothetical protein
MDDGNQLNLPHICLLTPPIDYQSYRLLFKKSTIIK